ncbi:zinc finger protein OZF-like [Athalia rosae]|uniref:zinc finger protein OZF-like n=1 Tax=Athalia rosae TaxID=37344 RepID=UPI0020332733|nr:zinc finger protein OZF-like [Athalia rosae]
METNIDTGFKVKNDSPATEHASNCQEYVDQFSSPYVKEELPYISEELVHTNTFSRCTQAGRLKECIRPQDQKITGFGTKDDFADNETSSENNFNCRNGRSSSIFSWDSLMKSWQDPPTHCDRDVSKSNTVMENNYKYTVRSDQEQSSTSTENVMPGQSNDFAQAEKEVEEDRAQCELCKKWVRKSYLIRHTRGHYAKRTHKCPQPNCNKSFIQKSKLLAHTQVHNGTRPYQCNICQKKFSQSSHLTVHISVHTGEKPFECNICNRKFTQKSALTVHSLIHTGQKSYECGVCQKFFRQKSHLTVHMKFHAGIKPYGCTICSKSFTRKSSLNRHELTHSKMKPHKCRICKKSFIQKSNLSRHIQTHMEHGVTNEFVECILPEMKTDQLYRT